MVQTTSLHLYRERTLAPFAEKVPAGRGLHSFTFQLNVSAFCGTRVA
jgi:apolipoprotein N-acyltransferase